MKKKLTTSVEELIKNRYGGSGRGNAGNAIRIEEPFSGYYGKPAVRKNKNGNTSPSVILSLGYDDGETLSQHLKERCFEEYVVQHSIADAEFEEYVVERGAQSSKRSIDAKVDVIPVEAVSAAQEYAVDVLQPWREATVPDSRIGENASPSDKETSRAKATEDDFIADMQSILTGQKVFDPVSKKTVEKDNLVRPSSMPGQNVGNDLPAPEAKNSQAIFDRIAQSMQYANAYDLGTVELENRFADFDKIFEMQQKAAAEKKSKTHQAPAGDAMVDSETFIQDLDAIRKQRSEVIPPSGRSSASTAIVEAANLDECSVSVAPNIAYSLTAFSLTWLPDVLRAAGLNVSLVNGWENRGHGDVGSILGVLCHHTAGPKTGNAPSLGTVTNGRTDLPGPLAQLVLARDGTYFVVAAGKCYHAGSGAWQGVTDGNAHFIGIEAENTGLSDDSPWPAVQMEAYHRGVAALLKHIGQAASWCAGHKEYALPLGRKIDPSFDMDAFRSSVAAIMQGTGPASVPTQATAVVPPVQVGAPAGRPTLRRGSTGDQVKQVQTKVGVTADGNFGPKTEDAVRALQRAHGLVPDGIVGPETWAALDSAATLTPSAP